MFDIRDVNRYGKFIANSSIGKVVVEITISGFGEKIIIYKNGNIIYNIDTLDEDIYYEEDDNCIEKCNKIPQEVYNKYIEIMKLLM